MFTGNIQFYTILKPLVGNSTVWLKKLVLQHKQQANKQSIFHLLIPFLLTQYRTQGTISCE